MNITDNGLSAKQTGYHHIYTEHQYPTNIDPLDLNDLVLRSIGSFNGPRKGIAVHHRLQKHLWTTLTMEGSILERALLNIFTNAWLSMPAGGALFIETLNKPAIKNPRAPAACHPREKDFICISITDMGTGLPVGHIDQIFDLMYHAGECRTGLGLAFVRAEIERYGGRVEVENTFFGGTTVRLLLPATDRSARSASYGEASYL